MHGLSNVGADVFNVPFYMLLEWRALGHLLTERAVIKKISEALNREMPSFAYLPHLTPFRS